MISCIAIDDEPLALDLLVDNIGKVPYLQLVAKCLDAYEAAEVLKQHKIDLIFTDIQMPGITGLQFIENLDHRPMSIIITAYKQFALDSYQFDVVDYLVKPVSQDRFLKACNKAQELYLLRNYQQNNSNKVPDYMFVNIGHFLQKVKFDDILYIEGLKYYINIHLKEMQSPLLTRATMKSVEQYLSSDSFIRIHKSFIAGTKYITGIKKNALIIDNHRELPIGEIYKSNLDKIIKHLL